MPRTPHSVAPIHTHLGPHLRWTTLGGEVGFFRVIEPTKAPLPQPSILASSCLCPSPAYGGRKPSPQQSPKARPHPPTVLPGSGRGHLNVPSPPKTFPQPLRPRTPTHLSVCPQEPSSMGDHWGHHRAGVTVWIWGSGQWVWGRLYPGWTWSFPLTPPKPASRVPQGSGQNQLFT